MSEKKQNKRWIYASRPDAEVSSNNFKLEICDIPEMTNDNNILVRSVYVSVDPYLRIQMSKKRTWEEPRETGGTQLSGAVCIVVKSNDNMYKEGDYVLTYTGWKLYSVVNSNEITKIDINSNLAPLSAALGALGMPGRTAYFGLLDVIQPKAGETLLVSGAAGAVGSLVCQIGKIIGCKVVGIAGRDDKIDFLLNELKIDKAINYKNANNYESILKELKEASPTGYDCYFDNVGGYITDAVFELINNFARIGICGQVSQYNDGLDEANLGPRFLHKLIYTRCKIQGMLSRDYKHRHQEMVDQMSQWIKDGKIKIRETIVEGFDELPNALNDMMNGANIGKMIVHVPLE